jgi:uncharacterized repeat protein (TIGR03803 family)
MVTPQQWARRVFLAVLILCSNTSAWAQTYSVLKTFEGLISPLSAPIRDAHGNVYELLAGGGTWGQGAIIKHAPDGTLTILHNFNGADGGRPAGDLLRDRHGNLYGAASFEGGGHAGTIFRLARGGTFTLLHTFNQNTDGGFPNGGLIRDRFGNLYGTASTGGPGGEGTVFKLAPDGTYTLLHSFAFDGKGSLPSGGLVRDRQGNLYGTTAIGGSGGGQFGGGTIFKLAPDGTHTILYSFTGGSDGAGPFGLLRVPGGDLVGLARSGGSNQQGTIFKLSTSGTFSVLFTLPNYPVAGLTRDLNGNLYGVAPQGGPPPGWGTVFKLAPDGTFSIVHSFAGGDDGFSPYTRPALDAAGNLYGTTLQGGPGGYGTLFTLAPDGTKTLLHGFSSVNPNGLALAPSGSLFGTTQRGGGGNGSVFELAPVGGTYTVLHSFDPGPDGAFPFASPILDGSNNLYGTTMIGGPNGIGTAFKLAANGTYTVLHGFGGFSPPDGRSPVARLVSDASGNLYGTASDGGANAMGGIVFKLTPGGAYSVLHSFGPPGDGLRPMAGLVIDAGGSLYGTTLQGGAAGAGIVFKLAPDGTYAILHSFAGADGTNPLGGLARDSSGNLYGTTSFGGASNFGTVFKIAPDGTYTVLHNFALADGASPQADLILDSISNLYGTTSAGGGANLGTVFKLAPDSTYSVVHSFSGDDGAFPTAGLVLSGSGVLYGTTSTGGPLAGGVVFQIAP